MDADLLTDMAIFAAVVEQDSFSGAAKQLALSKSNVSRRIAALEDRLNVTLMHRTTRRLSLTEAGRIYYDHCARMVAEARDADQVMKEMHARPSGVLNLSLPETLGRTFILPLLPEFLRSHPEIRLNLTITNRKLDFREERCDVAIRKGTIEDDTLTSIPLGASTQYFFASASYLKSAPKLESPDQLGDHAVLTSHVTKGPVNLVYFRGKERFEKKILPRLSVKDHEALFRMVLDGLGVGLLPAWMTHEDRRSGRLLRLFPGVYGPSVAFNLVYLPERAMAPNIRAFVEFLQNRLRLNRPWEIDESPDNLLPVASARN